MGAFFFPHVTIEGDIRLEEISRLPEVLETIRTDPLIHRKISFGTGNVVLQISSEIDSNKQPEIAVPTLFVHGTLDTITEYWAAYVSWLSHYFNLLLLLLLFFVVVKPRRNFTIV